MTSYLFSGGHLLDPRLGELVPGAHAYLLVIDGDPYRDLSVFQPNQDRILAIMLAGRFCKTDCTRRERA